MNAAANWRTQHLRGRFPTGSSQPSRARYAHVFPPNRMQISGMHEFDFIPATCAHLERPVKQAYTVRCDHQNDRAFEAEEKKYTEMRAQIDASLAEKDEELAGKELTEIGPHYMRAHYNHK